MRVSPPPQDPGSGQVPAPSSPMLLEVIASNPRRFVELVGPAAVGGHPDLLAQHARSYRGDHRSPSSTSAPAAGHRRRHLPRPTLELVCFETLEGRRRASPASRGVWSCSRADRAASGARRPWRTRILIAVSRWCWRPPSRPESCRSTTLEPPRWRNASRRKRRRGAKLVLTVLWGRALPPPRLWPPTSSTSHSSRPARIRLSIGPLEQTLNSARCQQGSNHRTQPCCSHSLRTHRRCRAPAV